MGHKVYFLQSLYYRTFHPALIRFAFRPDFYDTPEWWRVRHDCLDKWGSICLSCGLRAGERYPEDGKRVIIQADHVKPKSKYPWLALDPRNTQPMCRRCNMGKGNRHKTDWRKPRKPLIRVLAWCLKRLV